MIRPHPPLLTPALVLALALAACGGPPADEAPGEEREPGVLLESARQPLERAGAVEDLAAGRKDALDAQIAGGEGGD